MQLFFYSLYLVLELYMFRTQIASETCRVLTPNKENKKKLHLVGIYMTSITKMHGTMNIKLAILSSVS